MTQVLTVELETIWPFFIGIFLFSNVECLHLILAVKKVKMSFNKQFDDAILTKTVENSIVSDDNL